VVNCYDIGTGRKLWIHEFDESFYPSPILAAGRIYAMDNGDTMFIRGKGSLYCVGAR
jgi:hypothetical protein